MPLTNAERNDRQCLRVIFFTLFFVSLLEEHHFIYIIAIIIITSFPSSLFFFPLLAIVYYNTYKFQFGSSAGSFSRRVLWNRFYSTAALPHYCTSSSSALSSLTLFLFTSLFCISISDRHTQSYSCVYICLRAWTAKNKAIKNIHIWARIICNIKQKQRSEKNVEYNMDMNAYIFLHI